MTRDKWIALCAFVISGLTFCLALLLNRIAFIMQNPNFVFEQSNATSKWFEMNEKIVNIVTFAPLVLAILFLIYFIYLIFKK